jgi:hypothetical protein
MKFAHLASIALIAAVTSSQALAQEIPDLAGSWTCVGRCSGGPRIVQDGRSVTCINEHGDVSKGAVTGRRSFSGCWGLDSTVSEDLKSIDWHNQTLWIR